MSKKTSHSNSIENLDLSDVKLRSVRGIAIMGGRTFFMQALSLVAFFFLTVFLDQSEIGIFLIVSAVIGFLRYFSDIGLAASLIQKKDNPTNTQLRTTFTVQQILVLFILLVLAFLTPFLVKFYNLTNQVTMLLFAFGFSFFLASLKTIPSVLLERELKFEKLIIPDLLENLTYHVVAVFLAWLGYGVDSFFWAILARAIVGLVAIYVIRPWNIGFAFSFVELKQLLRFGIPYQLNTFLATIKDDGITAFIGGIIGTSGVGYLGWAQKWSQTPLRLIMDNVMKVTFPAFSRMQEQKDYLIKAVNKSIFFVCALIFPSVVGMVVLSSFVLDLLPNYEKWRPALVPLFLVSINTMFAAATTPLTNLLNATGRIKITFYLMLMWVLLTWLFIPVLSIFHGVNGAALGYAIVGSSSIVAIFVARKIFKFDIAFAIYKPLFSSVLMGIFVFLLSKLMTISLLSLIALILLGGLIYLATLYLFAGDDLVKDIKKIISQFIRKN
ncbi:MAG: oligosaccharide flippase family protein [Patescibacteria group bacterium]|nr:oligosaccharide flippase family protein [Patescibacteria group bacterium]